MNIFAHLDSVNLQRERERASTLAFIRPEHKELNENCALR